jgi:phage terminase large subunit GpA-like protein
MAGAQVGKSESGNNWLGYIIDVSPASTIVVQPTVDIAKKFSKQRIATMIEESAVLKDKIKTARSRDSGNTVLTKEFQGGMLNIVGANSAAGLRSIPARNLFMDEIDAYPLDVDGEGDPIELARKRTNTFGNKKKIFLTSTPTIKHISAIEREHDKGDQRKYFVPCPFCSGKQHLIFNNLKFITYPNNKKKVMPDSVHYECQFCKKEIKEHHKTLMLDSGEWIPQNPNTENKNIRSYHLNSLYSPIGWKSWESICDEFLESKSDNFKLKTFINTVLAETWESDGTQVNYVELLERVEPYKFFNVNKKAIFLTAGVDVQDNRLCILINAWGENEETWVVGYHEMLGNPAEDDVWIELNKLVRRPYKHESGMDLYIRKAGIDTGGHFTQRVYDFCKKQNDKFIPIKGSSNNLSTVITSKPNKDNVYFIGTSLVKEEIYSRFNLKEEGDRYVHFSEDLNEEFFKMLTAEKMITKILKGMPRNEWIKIYNRNEALDCFVYSYAIAYHLGIKRMDYRALYKQIIGDLEPVKESKIEEEKPTDLNKNIKKLMKTNVKKGFVKRF